MEMAGGQMSAEMSKQADSMQEGIRLQENLHHILDAFAAQVWFVWHSEKDFLHNYVYYRGRAVSRILEETADPPKP